MCPADKVKSTVHSYKPTATDTTDYFVIKGVVVRSVAVNLALIAAWTWITTITPWLSGVSCAIGVTALCLLGWIQLGYEVRQNT